MKYHEIVGWVGEAELLCEDHARGVFDGEDGQSVFAGECAPDAYCGACLAQWIDKTPSADRADGAPDWVYLLGERP